MGKVSGGVHGGGVQVGEEGLDTEPGMNNRGRGKNMETMGLWLLCMLRAIHL